MSMTDEERREYNREIEFSRAEESRQQRHIEFMEELRAIRAILVTLTTPIVVDALASEEPRR